MSENLKRQLMKTFVSFINTADKELGQKIISTEADFYVPGNPKPKRGLEGYLDIIGMMRSGFPDIQWTLEDTIIENEKVAARFTVRGTHQGDFFGVPATGKPIEMQAINIYYFANDQIVEEYGQPDLMGLMQQLGAIPGS